MVLQENTNWLYDYGFEDISVADANFSVSGSGFSWSAQALNGSASVRWWTIKCMGPSKHGNDLFLASYELFSVLTSDEVLPASGPCAELDGSCGDNDGSKETGSKKRSRTELCASTSSKACREKLRRDKLNDRFTELSALLEPGKLPKTDKSAILVDAVRVVTQLRSEAQKLKDSNLNLQEKIKELKAEKIELRDEKQRLKAEKEKLEQQLKTMNAQPGFLPPAIPAAFAAQGQVAGSKLVPVISYPGVAMWQFLPPAAVDTSQDHVLRPPVA